MLSEPNLTDQDYESLSAYIDEMLEDSERLALEARLSAEPLLRRELAALRQTVALIHQLPTLKAPRNFTLPVVAIESEAKSASSPPLLRVTQPEKPRRIIPFPLISALSAAAAAILIFVGVGLILSGNNDLQFAVSRDAEFPNDVSAFSSPTAQFTDDSLPSATLSALFANTGELSTEERLTLSASVQTTALYSAATQTASEAASEAEIGLTAIQLYNLFLTPTLTYATSAAAFIAPAAPSQPMTTNAAANMDSASGSAPTGGGGTGPTITDDFDELGPSVANEGAAGMAQMQIASTPTQTALPTQEMEAASGLSANEANAAEASDTQNAAPSPLSFAPTPIPSPDAMTEARAVETDLSVETDAPIENTVIATTAGSAASESQIAQAQPESTQSLLDDAQDTNTQEQQTAPPLTPKDENDSSNNAVLGGMLIVLGGIAAGVAVFFYIRQRNV